MNPEAKVVLDSISPDGHRLTTMEVRMHRFVLAEFNTHRVFSRNSASSRAIPVEKQLKRVIEETAWPLEYPAEQPGMQGGAHLMGRDLEDAQNLVFKLYTAATSFVEEYLDSHPEKSSRLHKSVINRYLEPFMDHRVIVTATEWDNFFALRANPLAQPEIRVAAEAMLEAYKASHPKLTRYNEWHTPYIQEDEYEEYEEQFLCKISAARCARVSYLTHDGLRDVDKDLELFYRLTDAVPPHASPLEHVATPTTLGGNALGNFVGWSQLRHLYWK